VVLSRRNLLFFNRAVNGLVAVAETSRAAAPRPLAAAGKGADVKCRAR
jgi:hypothetical protein